MHPVTGGKGNANGNCDGNAIHPLTFEGLMLMIMLMALGIQMVMFMCRIAMVMLLVQDTCF